MLYSTKFTLLLVLVGLFTFINLYRPKKIDYEVVGNFKLIKNGHTQIYIPLDFELNQSEENGFAYSVDQFTGIRFTKGAPISELMNEVKTLEPDEFIDKLKINVNSSSQNYKIIDIELDSNLKTEDFVQIDYSYTMRNEAGTISKSKYKSLYDFKNNISYLISIAYLESDESSSKVHNLREGFDKSSINFSILD